MHLGSIVGKPFPSRDAMRPTSLTPETGGWLDRPDYVAAVWLGIPGGTKATVNYALNKKKPVSLRDVAQQTRRWVRHDARLDGSLCTK